MPDEQSERTRWIKGFRWCPYSETIQQWEEDQESGCLWCEVDTDSLGPHLKLVLARASDESYAAYERLRDHVNTLSYAEMGEPESVVAQMWAYYTAACKSKTLNGQITNLVRGLAQAALIAVANGRWARGEHNNAIKLHETLTGVLEATKPEDGDWLPEERRVVLEAARIVLRDTRLYSQRPEPPFAVNLDLPVPDPDPDAPEPAETPKTPIEDMAAMQRVPEAEGKTLSADGLAFYDKEAERWRCIKCGAKLTTEGECDCPRPYEETDG